MQNKQPNNPLHGIKLADIVEYLYNEFGWEGLGRKIKINSFTKDPSIKSSLKFLRKTDWARKEVEDLYLKTVRRNSKKKLTKESRKSKIEIVDKKTKEIPELKTQTIEPKKARKFGRKKAE